MGDAIPGSDCRSDLHPAPVTSFDVSSSSSSSWLQPPAVSSDGRPLVLVIDTDDGGDDHDSDAADNAVGDSAQSSVSVGGAARWIGHFSPSAGQRSPRNFTAAGRGAHGRVVIAPASPLFGGLALAVKTMPTLADDARATAAGCELAFARRVADIVGADPSADDRLWRHIARLYGVTTDRARGDCHVVAEPLLGGSLLDLSRMLHHEETSNVAATVRTVAQQLLLALETLHLELFTLHNDVTLTNALLVSTSVAGKKGQLTVKLIDFGCASVLQLGADMSVAAALPQQGSLSTMAPERLRGDPYGPKADVWSVGVLLLRLIDGGLHPFLPPDADATEEKFWRLMKALKFADDAATHAKATTAAVDAAIDRCRLHHDALFRKFVHRALRADVSERASVTELLANPWFQ